jgi:hypothetical protein
VQGARTVGQVVTSSTSALMNQQSAEVKYVGGGTEFKITDHTTSLDHGMDFMCKYEHTPESIADRNFAKIEGR